MKTKVWETPYHSQSFKGYPITLFLNARFSVSVNNSLEDEGLSVVFDFEWSFEYMSLSIRKSRKSVFAYWLRERNELGRSRMVLSMEQCRIDSSQRQKIPESNLESQRNQTQLLDWRIRQYRLNGWLNYYLLNLFSIYKMLFLVLWSQNLNSYMYRILILIYLLSINRLINQLLPWI